MLKNRTIYLIALIIVLQGFVFLASNDIDKSIVRQLFWISALTIPTLLLAALCWQNKYSKWLAVVMVTLITANFSTACVMRLIYKSSLSISVADSIFNTNTDEVSSMYWLYLPYLWIPLLFFPLCLYTVHCLAKNSFSRTKLVFALFSIVIPSLMYVNYSFAEKYRSGKEPASSLVLEKTPLYNGYYFSQALFFREQSQRIHETKVDYQLSVADNGIENYVILIGEAARPKNMSLYGYGRKTTPTLDAQKDNMLVFNHAFAPAPITTLAVPMILSQVKPDNYDIPALSDNLINLANAAGFNTYWYSVQGSTGADANIVTSMGSFAQKKEWLSGYDPVLLDKLNYALSHKGRNVIFLHINGSHELACKRYPPERAVFSGGANQYDDCYDNSILYTDALIQEIITALNGKSAVMIYLADHGLERDEAMASLYYHGNAKPTQEAFDAPFVVWYSPEVDKTLRKTGVVTEKTPLTELYPMLKTLMGITDTHPAKTVSNEQDKKEAIVLDGTLTVLPYNGLRKQISPDMQAF